MAERPPLTQVQPGELLVIKADHHALLVRVVQTPHGLDTPLVVEEIATGTHHEYGWAAMPSDCRSLSATEHHAVSTSGPQITTIADLAVGDVLINTPLSYQEPEIVRVVEISTTEPVADVVVGRVVLERVDTGDRYARSGTTLGPHWRHTSLPGSHASRTLLLDNAFGRTATDGFVDDREYDAFSKTGSLRRARPPDVAGGASVEADGRAGAGALTAWKELGATLFEPARMLHVPDPDRHPDVAAALARTRSARTAEQIREAFLDGWFEASTALTDPLWASLRGNIAADPDIVSTVRRIGRDPETLSRTEEFVALVADKIAAIPDTDLAQVAVRDARRRYSRSGEHPVATGLAFEIAEAAVARARRDWRHPFVTDTDLRRWREWANTQLASDPLVSTWFGQPLDSRRDHVLGEVVTTVLADLPEHLPHLGIDPADRDTRTWLRADIYQRIQPALARSEPDSLWRETARGWRPGSSDVEVVHRRGAWWVLTHGGAHADCWGSDHRAALAQALLVADLGDNIRPGDRAIHARVHAIRTALTDRARPALAGHEFIHAAARSPVLNPDTTSERAGDAAIGSAYTREAVRTITEAIGEAEPVLLTHARALGLDPEQFLRDTAAAEVLTDLHRAYHPSGVADSDIQQPLFDLAPLGSDLHAGTPSTLVIGDPDGAHITLVHHDLWIPDPTGPSVDLREPTLTDAIAAARRILATAAPRPETPTPPTSFAVGGSTPDPGAVEAAPEPPPRSGPPTTLPTAPPVPPAEPARTAPVIGVPYLGLSDIDRAVIRTQIQDWGHNYHSVGSPVDTDRLAYRIATSGLFDHLPATYGLRRVVAATAEALAAQPEALTWRWSTRSRNTQNRHSSAAQLRAQALTHRDAGEYREALATLRQAHLTDPLWRDDDGTSYDDLASTIQVLQQKSSTGTEGPDAYTEAWPPHPFRDEASVRAWRDWAAAELAANPLIALRRDHGINTHHARLLDELTDRLIDELPQRRPDLALHNGGPDIGDWLAADIHHNIVPTLLPNAEGVWTATRDGWGIESHGIEICWAADSWVVRTSPTNSEKQDWGDDHRAAMGHALHTAGYADLIPPDAADVRAHVKAARHAFAEHARAMLLGHEMLHAVVRSAALMPKDVDTGSMREARWSALSITAIHDSVTEITTSAPELVRAVTDRGIDADALVWDDVVIDVLRELRRRHLANAPASGDPVPGADLHVLSVNDIITVGDPDGEHIVLGRRIQPRRAGQRAGDYWWVDISTVNSPIGEQHLRAAIDHARTILARRTTDISASSTDNGTASVPAVSQHHSSVPDTEVDSRPIKAPRPALPTDTPESTTATPESAPRPQDSGATPPHDSALTLFESDRPLDDAPATPPTAQLADTGSHSDAVVTTPDLPPAAQPSVRDSSRPATLPPSASVGPQRDSAGAGSGRLRHESVWSRLLRPVPALIPQDLADAHALVDTAISNHWQVSGRFLPHDSDGVIYRLTLSGQVGQRIEDITLRWRHRSQGWVFEPEEPTGSSDDHASGSDASTDRTDLEAITRVVAAPAARLPHDAAESLDAIVATVLTTPALAVRGLDSYDTYCARVAAPVYAAIDAACDDLLTDIAPDADAVSAQQGAVLGLRANAWARRELAGAIAERAWIGHDFTDVELARVHRAVEDHTHDLYRPRMGIGEEGAVRYTAETYVERQFDRSLRTSLWQAVAAHVATHRDEVLVCTDAQLSARQAARTAIGDRLRAHAQTALVAADPEPALRALADADRIESGSAATERLRAAALDHFGPETDAPLAAVPATAAPIVDTATALGWRYHYLTVPQHSVVLGLRYRKDSGERYHLRLVWDDTNRGLIYNPTASRASRIGEGPEPISVRPGPLQLTNVRRIVASLAGQAITTLTPPPQPVALSNDQRHLLWAICADATVAVLAAALADPEAAMADLFTDRVFSTHSDVIEQRPVWGDPASWEISAESGVLHLRGVTDLAPVSITRDTLTGFALQLPAEVRGRLDHHADLRILRQILRYDILDIDGPTRTPEPAPAEHTPTVKIDPAPPATSVASHVAEIDTGRTPVTADHVAPAPAEDPDSFAVIADEYLLLRAAAHHLIRADRSGTRYVIGPADKAAVAVADAAVIEHLTDQGHLDRDQAAGRPICTPAGQNRGERLRRVHRSDPALGDRVLDLGSGEVAVVCDHLDLDDTTRWAEIVVASPESPHGTVHTVDPLDLAVIEPAAVTAAEARALYRLATGTATTPEPQHTPGTETDKSADESASATTTSAHNRPRPDSDSAPPPTTETPEAGSDTAVSGTITEQPGDAPSLAPGHQTDSTPVPSRYHVAPAALRVEADEPPSTVPAAIGDMAATDASPSPLFNDAGADNAHRGHPSPNAAVDQTNTVASTFDSPASHPLAGGVAALPMPTHRAPSPRRPDSAPFPQHPPPTEILKLTAAARARGWQSYGDVRGYGREWHPPHWWATFLARTSQGMRRVSLQFDRQPDENTYTYNPQKSFVADEIFTPPLGIYGWQLIEAGQLIHDRPRTPGPRAEVHYAPDLDELAHEIWESGRTSIYHQPSTVTPPQPPQASAAQRATLSDIVTAHGLADPALNQSASNSGAQTRQVREFVHRTLHRYIDTPTDPVPGETTAAAHHVAAQVLAEFASVDEMASVLAAKLDTTGRNERDQLLVTAVSGCADTALRRSVELGLDLTHERISVVDRVGVNPLYRIESGGMAFLSTLSRAQGLHSVWVADEHTLGWQSSGAYDPFLHRSWPSNTAEIMPLLRGHAQRVAELAAMSAKIRAQREIETPQPHPDEGKQQRVEGTASAPRPTTSTDPVDDAWSLFDTIDEASTVDQAPAATEPTPATTTAPSPRTPPITHTPGTAEEFSDDQLLLLYAVAPEAMAAGLGIDITRLFTNPISGPLRADIVAARPQWTGLSYDVDTIGVRLTTAGNTPVPAPAAKVTRRALARFAVALPEQIRAQLAEHHTLSDTNRDHLLRRALRIDTITSQSGPIISSADSASTPLTADESASAATQPTIVATTPAAPESASSRHPSETAPTPTVAEPEPVASQRRSRSSSASTSRGGRIAAELSDATLAVAASPAVAVAGEKFPPTPQQQTVYDQVLAGRDVKVQAGAGAGKTSTLEGLARRIGLQDPTARIAYIAFNKSVQEEATERMPPNVEPRTGHSIAYQWAPKPVQDRTDDEDALRRPDEVARHLSITRTLPSGQAGPLSVPEQAMAALRTVDTYATSADDRIGRSHLPVRIQEMPAATQDRVVKLAERVWADLTSEDGQLRLTLDHVRKMWALSRPDLTAPGAGLRRAATVLFLDEAQDTPPVLARVVAEQRMRKVIVGDQDQAIYSFTGAVDFLHTATADIELPLTKSWRFGPQVADIGNRFLQMLDSNKRIEGGGADSHITEPATLDCADAILVRSNAGAIAEIARELAAGGIVGVPKGTKAELTSLVNTARFLQGKTTAPRRMHDDLAPFRSWSEVLAESQNGDDPKLVMLVGMVERNGIDALDALVRRVQEHSDEGLDGVKFRDTDHGLIAEGNTYPVRSILGRAGFDRRPDPEGRRQTKGKDKGQPLQVWIATGSAGQRKAVHARALQFATPDVIVSTAHKAKGLEWDQVRIGDDFKGPKRHPSTGELILPSAEELRLAYVAVTRARRVLDPGSLAYAFDHTSVNGGTPPPTPPHPALDPPTSCQPANPQLTNAISPPTVSPPEPSTATAEDTNADQIATTITTRTLDTLSDTPRMPPGRAETASAPVDFAQADNPPQGSQPLPRLVDLTEPVPINDAGGHYRNSTRNALPRLETGTTTANSAAGQSNPSTSDADDSPHPRIVIVHTSTATLVHGTTSDDYELHKRLKAFSFRFSGSIGDNGAWYLPRRWGHRVRSNRVRQLEEALDHTTITYRTQSTDYVADPELPVISANPPEPPESHPPNALAPTRDNRDDPPTTSVHTEVDAAAAGGQLEPGAPADMTGQPRRSRTDFPSTTLNEPATLDPVATIVSTPVAAESIGSQDTSPFFASNLADPEPADTMVIDGGAPGFPLPPAEATTIAERATRSRWRVHHTAPSPDTPRDYYRLTLEAHTVRGHRRYVLRWRVQDGNPIYDQSRSLAGHFADARDDDGRRPTLEEVRNDVGFAAIELTTANPLPADDIVDGTDFEALIGAPLAEEIPQALLAPLRSEHAAKTALLAAEANGDTDWRTALTAQRTFTEARIARLTAELDVDPSTWTRGGDRRALLRELDGARQDFAAALREYPELSELERQQLQQDIALLGASARTEPREPVPAALMELVNAEIDALSALRGAPDPDDRPALVPLQIAHCQAQIARLSATLSTPEYDGPQSPEELRTELDRALADLGAHRAVEQIRWQARDLIAARRTPAQSGDADPRAVLDAIDAAVWSIADAPDQAGEVRAQLELGLFRLHTSDQDRTQLLAHLDHYITARTQPAPPPGLLDAQPDANTSATSTGDHHSGSAAAPTPSEQEIRAEVERLETLIFERASASEWMTTIATGPNRYDQYLDAAIEAATDIIVEVVDEDLGTAPDSTVAPAWSHIAGRGNMEALALRVADTVWRTHHPVTVDEPDAAPVGLSTARNDEPTRPDSGHDNGPSDAAALSALIEHAAGAGPLAQLCAAGDADLYRGFALPAASQILQRLLHEDPKSTTTSADTIDTLVRGGARALAAGVPEDGTVAESLARSVWQHATGSAYTAPFDDEFNPAFESFDGLIDAYVDQDDGTRYTFEIAAAGRVFAIGTPQSGSSEYRILAQADEAEREQGGGETDLELPTADSPAQILSVIREFHRDVAEDDAAWIAERTEPPEATRLAEEASARGWDIEEDFHQPHPRDRRYELLLASPKAIAPTIRYRLRFDLAGPFGAFVYNPGRSSRTIGTAKTLGMSLAQISAEIAPPSRQHSTTQAPPPQSRTRTATPTQLPHVRTPVAAEPDTAQALRPAPATASTDADHDTARPSQVHAVRAGGPNSEQARPSAPAEGSPAVPVTELSAVQRAIITCITDDYAALYKGRGGAREAARYVAEVAVRKLPPGHTIEAVEAVARARIAERGKEILKATQAQVRQRQRDRTETAARLRNVEAIAAYRRGEFTEAIALIDRAELADPFWVDDAGAGYEPLRQRILEAQRDAQTQDADDDYTPVVTVPVIVAQPDGPAAAGGSAELVSGTDRVPVARNWVHPGVVTVPSGKRGRARANMDTIEILARLDAEDRPASATEQPQLAAYSGWGAVPEIFDPRKTDWDADRERLRELLDADAFDTAAESTLNAHYTDPAVAKAMWTAVIEAGFSGGRVLEPGGGTGTFVGLAPTDAQMVVVENEPISARVTHRLYPDALVRLEGFEHTHLPPSSFVAAIGNVPFGKWEVRDPKYNPRGHMIHNAFILKALAMTAPGGYVAVISSAWTMDAVNDMARTDMLALADFVGAVRLPGAAFTRVAGTPVVTDIIVLRKREPPPDPTKPPEQPDAVVARNLQFQRSVEREFIDTVTGENTSLPINTWFTENPQYVLGEVSAGHGMYRGGSLNVTHEDLSLLPKQVGAALTEIVRTASRQGLALTARAGDLAEHPEPSSGLAVGDPDQMLTHPIGMMRHRDGGFEAVTEFGTWEPVNVYRTRARETRELLHLRDLAHQLVSAQRENLGPHERAQARARLNRAYDDYLSRYGPINRFTWQGGRERSQQERDKRYAELEIKWRNKHSDDDGHPYVGALPAEVVEELDDKAWTAVPRSKKRQHLEGAIGRDPTMASVLALEHFDERTGRALKANIFTKDVVTTPRTVTSTDNAAEALSISLGAGRGVDLGFIAELLKVDEASARKRLQGQVFADPDRPDTLVPAAKYLSGDVRAKLTHARLAAAADPAFAENVAALESVAPEWREAPRIKVQPGTVWIPTEDYADFVTEIFGLADVKASRVSGVMRFESSSKASERERSWSTRHRSALELLEALCNSKNIVVHHTAKEMEAGAPLVNTKATAQAQAQADRIRVEFRRWLWADEQRRERLVALFNNTLNCWVEPRHDGRFLELAGLSSEITPYRYQLDGAARGISEPTTQLDHVVGAGKTGTMLMIAWELRRRGLVNQPWLVVPNHIVEDVVLYAGLWFPTAKILSAPQGLTAAERRRFVAQTATSDWDFVIVGMSTFEKIGVKPARRARYIKDQLAELDAVLASVDNDDGTPDRSFKDLMRARKHLQKRLEKLTEAAKDIGLTLEDSGLDYVLIDEFHLYKNKARYSPVPELALSPGSGRAENIALVLKMLEDRAAAAVLARGATPVFDNMRIATAATGTRIANALAEEWVHQQYLRPDLLRERGLLDVTDWGSVFTTTKSVITTNAAGTSVKAEEKIASYANLPQMLALTRIYTDVVTRKQVPAKLPAMRGGQRLIVTTVPSQEIKDFIADLDYRMSELDPDKSWKDNPLKILSDGRNAALDAQLVGLDAELTQTRAYVVAREMLTRHHATKNNRYRAPNGDLHPVPGALQIGFCDRGTPTSDTKDRSLYATLKNLLIAGLPELGLNGMPADKIAFIHDARKPSEKRQLSDDCRNGHIAILLGSTEKMGTGMNIQTRAIAEHHIDVPWRPDFLEQREGRVIRQQNQNDEVDIIVYAAEGTIDAFMWSKVQTKAEFIEQARTGKVDVDEIEQSDDADIVQAAAMTKAVSTGDPRFVQMAELEQKVRQLSVLEEAHAETRARAQWRIKSLPADIRRTKRLVDTATPHLAAAAAWANQPGIIVVGGQNFTDRGKANKALLHAARCAFLEADAAYKQRHLIAEPQAIANLDGHPILASLDVAYGILRLKIGELPVSTSIERADLFPQAKTGTGETNDPDKATRAAKTPDDAATARGLTARITNAYNGLDTKVIQLRADLEQMNADLAYSKNIIGAPFDRADEFVAAKVELTQLRLDLDAAENSPEAIAAREARDERLCTQGRLPGWSLYLNPTEATVKNSSFATKDQYVAAVRANMAERAALYAAGNTTALAAGTNDPITDDPVPEPAPESEHQPGDASASSTSPPPQQDPAPTAPTTPTTPRAPATITAADRRRQLQRQPRTSSHAPKL
ncbi:UvrD-helicase domain-containing protein [Nocardia sp. NPDC050630]|uniref:UvrD-helicase domain-containing protein n=1 Tax=Nocardia sp. NPDC050630 TaxID=3364321 RepID=UPI0037A79A01